MRFYQRTRTYRLWGSAIWSALLLFWIGAIWVRHARQHFHPWIWILLSLTQLGSVWAYWEITPTELVGSAFGLPRRLRLSSIDSVGRPRPTRRFLAHTVQVESRGRQSLFVQVENRQAFEEALRRAIMQQVHEPGPVGPLSLRP